MNKRTRALQIKILKQIFSGPTSRKLKKMYISEKQNIYLLMIEGNRIHKFIKPEFKLNPMAFETNDSICSIYDKIVQECDDQDGLYYTGITKDMDQTKAFEFKSIFDNSKIYFDYSIILEFGKPSDLILYQSGKAYIVYHVDCVNETGIIMPLVL